MTKGRGIDLGMKAALDELFMDDVGRYENRLPKIYDIPLSQIDDFPKHPFQVRLDEDMDQLVASIRERGLITPITLRQKEDGRYEIVSGHRRRKACEMAGLDSIRAEIKELTRDEAIILMVESNLQRSVILPSEKAFAYKMRLDAMKRQGERTDLTSTPVARKLERNPESAELLGEAVGESKDQVRRYIRLTNLVPELLEMVDEGKIALRPAVEISYLTEDEQAALVEAINLKNCTPSHIHPSFIVPAQDTNGFPRLNSNISFDLQKSAASHYNKALTNADNDSFWTYKTFTYFGRIDENKGVDHILAAWHLLYLKYGSLCPPLWLIGGSLNEISSMRIKCLNVLPQLFRAEQEGKVIWWGCLDPVGASTLLLKTLVLVTNSLYEPGGRVIIEAMSEGVPVIAAPNGFAFDLVKNWENGFLVPHGNETELARRMEHFVRQPLLSNVLGENARQTAKNVVREWDFLNQHLCAYGISSSNKKVEKETCVNYFESREVNIFPYCKYPLSDELLCDFLYDCTGEKAIKAPERTITSGTSDIYQIQSTCRSYIIKHPYTRLSLGPLVSPIRKKEYVRSAIDFYNYEVHSLFATYIQKKLFA